MTVGISHVNAWCSKSLYKFHPYTAVSKYIIYKVEVIGIQGWVVVAEHRRVFNNVKIYSCLILKHFYPYFWLHLLYNAWYNSSRNRDSKCFRINLYQLFSSIFYISQYFWTLTCLHDFLTFLQSLVSHSLFKFARIIFHMQL